MPSAVRASACQLDEDIAVDVVAVERRLLGGARQCGGEIGQQLRVGVPGGEVHDPVGELLGEGASDRGSLRDPRAAATVGQDEPTPAQDGVGGLDGRRADLESGRERAHGGQLSPGGDVAAPDARLDRGGDVACALAGEMITF